MFEDWILRLRSLFKRATVERELDDELQFHVELQVASLLAQGLTQEEAVRRARLSFGMLDQIKEEHRDARGIRLVDDLDRDVRYAIRQLRRSPGFAIAAILCLAIGIGSTTTISSIVNTVLLEPLPFTDSHRLIRVVEHAPPLVPGRPVMQRLIEYHEFVDWQERATTLSGSFAVFGMGQRLVRTRRGPAGLWGAATSADTFTVLGVSALLGRALVSADAANPDVAVLTFDTWQRYFDADPSVVGTTLELRPGALQRPAPTIFLTVVGVLPSDFEFPNRSSDDFYTPLRPIASGEFPGVVMYGRLAPGVSLVAATEELNAFGAAIRPPWPTGAPPLTGPRFELQRLKDFAVRDLKPALDILITAVVVVLLIACANVANLLLARGMARQREMAVRLAIGASRGRIIRQVLTECLVLAIVGGTLGALIGAAGVATVKRLATVDAPGIFALMFGSTILPRANEVRVDFMVLVFALSIAAASSVVFGVLPALQLSRTEPIRATITGGRGVGAAGSRTRASLAVVQQAMATVLLIGAGLLIHSFVRLSFSNKGYDASNVVALQLLVPNEYSAAQKAETVGATLTRLRQLPAVRAVGFARHGLLIGEELWIGTFVPPGRSVAEMRSDPTKVRVRSVSDGFLTAMGVLLLDGRELEAGDVASAPPVIVINRSAARELFGSDRSVGQLVNWYIDDAPVQMTVVGVVEDLRQESLADETFPEVYVDYRQFLTLLERRPQFAERQNEIAIGFLSFALRVGDTPESVIPAVRRLIEAIDPNIGIDALVPMTRLVAGSLARERFSVVVLGTFAGVAGLLATIGIYGVLTYIVVQRTPEIGIRMALGAQRSEVLGFMLRRGLIMTSIGITLGLLGAVAVTRVLQGMLFGITPLDPLTFLAVAVMFGLVSTVASYVPARRATLVDPMVALRNE